MTLNDMEMEYPSNSERISELKRQLRIEQDQYILAITSEIPRSAKEIVELRRKIRTLQQQVDSISGGYNGS